MIDALIDGRPLETRQVAFRLDCMSIAPDARSKGIAMEARRRGSKGPITDSSLTEVLPLS